MSKQCSFSVLRSVTTRAALIITFDGFGWNELGEHGQTNGRSDATKYIISLQFYTTAFCLAVVQQSYKLLLMTALQDLHVSHINVIMSYT